MLESEQEQFKFADWTYEIGESEIRRLLKFQVKYYLGGGLPGALPLEVHSKIMRDMGEKFLTSIQNNNSNEVMMAYNYAKTPGEVISDKSG